MFRFIASLSLASCLFVTGCNIPENFYEREVLNIVDDFDQEEHKLLDQPQTGKKVVRVRTRQTLKTQ